MMGYYLNVQFQGQRVKCVFKSDGKKFLLQQTVRLQEVLTVPNDLRWFPYFVSFLHGNIVL